MNNITIMPVVGTALHHRYPSQSAPQDCYVSLDCETGTLSADWNGEIGNAVPARVYHGHVQRWGIPALKADAANALLEDIAPLAERMFTGHESVWDGGNHVARFNADANLARDEIAILCDGCDDPTECLQVWQAADWLTGSRDSQREQAGITGLTTASELEAIEARLTDEALSDMDVIEGMERLLCSLRDEVRTQCCWCDETATTYDRDDDPACVEHAGRTESVSL